MLFWRFVHLDIFSFRSCWEPLGWKFKNASKHTFRLHLNVDKIHFETCVFSMNSVFTQFSLLTKNEESQCEKFSPYSSYSAAITSSIECSIGLKREKLG